MRDYKVGDTVRDKASGLCGTVTQVRIKLRVLFPINKTVWVSRYSVELVKERS
jgi:hypothetical protein